MLSRLDVVEWYNERLIHGVIDHLDGRQALDGTSRRRKIPSYMPNMMAALGTVRIM